MLGESWAGATHRLGVLPDLAAEVLGRRSRSSPTSGDAFEAARIIDVVAPAPRAPARGGGAHAAGVGAGARPPATRPTTTCTAHGAPRPPDRLPHRGRRTGDPAGRRTSARWAVPPCCSPAAATSPRRTASPSSGCRGAVAAGPGRAADPADPAARLGDRPTAGAWPWTVSATTRTTRSWPEPVTRSISVIGNVQLDVLASPVTGDAAAPAGTPSSTASRCAPPAPPGTSALALAALGTQHRLFGAVGDDDAGRWVAAELQRLGLAATSSWSQGRPPGSPSRWRRPGGSGRSSPRTAC